MKKLKNSHYADGIGYLYRAALYMAQGQKELAISFVKTAEEKIGKQIILPKSGNDRYVAEKILDSYRNFLIMLPRVDSNHEPYS